MKTLNLLFITLLLFFFGCKKDNEKVNTAPTITTITASPTKIGYSITSNLNVIAEDKENDALTYEWSCSEGTFASPNGKSTINWLAPNKEGVFQCSLKVSDGKESITSTVDIEVMGIFYDDFSSFNPNWGVVNADAHIDNSAAYIKGNTNNYNGLLLYEFTSPVKPGYYVSMEICRNSTFDNDQEYFAELEFDSDEDIFDIYALSLLIYPSNTESNWAVICYVYDKTTSEGEWVLVDNNSLGHCSFIKGGQKEMNSIEFKIDADKNFQVKLNNNFLYSSTVLKQTELDGIPVPLKLSLIGAGTLYDKEIILDNVLVRENGSTYALTNNSNRSICKTATLQRTYSEVKNFHQLRTIKSYLKTKLDK